MGKANKVFGFLDCYVRELDSSKAYWIFCISQRKSALTVEEKVCLGFGLSSAVRIYTVSSIDSLDFAMSARDFNDLSFCL